MWGLIQDFLVLHIFFLIYLKKHSIAQLAGILADSSTIKKIYDDFSIPEVGKKVLRVSSCEIVKKVGFEDDPNNAKSN